MIRPGTTEHRRRRSQGKCKGQRQGFGTQQKVAERWGWKAEITAAKETRTKANTGALNFQSSHPWAMNSRMERQGRTGYGYLWGYRYELVSVGLCRGPHFLCTTNRSQMRSQVKWTFSWQSMASPMYRCQNALLVGGWLLICNKYFGLKCPLP